MSYHESFVAGDGAAGAYICQLTITSDGLALAFVASAVRARRIHFTYNKVNYLITNEYYEHFHFSLAH
jgi:hypothetical protein